MAQYKVPQDVEADDKLLGPFSFRQFVYLMIMVGGIALAVALFQVFPFLAIIPVPVIIFFAVLALPLKKDQPMETYLAAIVSYHLKPKTRYWNPGQRESTILITAPKQTEDNRARNISGEEASRRLSFLANVVDSEGYSVKENASTMQDSFLAEAETARDILDDYSSPVINQMIQQNQNNRHDEIVAQMRSAIAQTENPAGAQPIPQPQPMQPQQPQQNQPPNPYASLLNQSPEMLNVKTASEKPPEPSLYDSPAVVRPDLSVMKRAAENKAKLASLAYENDLSVATIAQQAARIEESSRSNLSDTKTNETFVSIHKKEQS